MSYYLGVDAGGSKTYAIVSDAAGRLLGKGSAGNGNHQIGLEEARTNLGAAVQTALAGAGISASETTHAYFGLAGADREADYAILHPLVQRLGFSDNYTITGDTMIGLRAGTSRPYGISVICGTGVNCAGINTQGEAYQCGGFSYMYGDFGGGGGLSVEVFRTVVRAWDGREPETLLTPMLLEMLHYETVSDMYNDYLDHDRMVPADAARLLFDAAAAGDAAALRILRHQGEELALSVRSVVNHLGLGSAEFDVVLAGSLLTRGDQGWISAPIANMLEQTAPAASLVKLETEPVIGALWAALEAGGIEITEDMHSRMSQYKEYDQLLTD